MADRERPQDEGRERGEGRGFGRPGRRDFDRDRPRRDFDRDRPRREFDRDRPRREFDRDRPRRDFDRERPRREFDPGRPRRDFDPDRPRRQFDRPRRDFDRRPPGRGPVRPSFVADRRPPPPRTDLVGDDEELVAGRRPVAEAFAARRDARRLLVVPERRAALESIVLHATTLRLQIVEVEGGTLTSLCGFDGHQGVALVVAQREPIGIDEMLERARSRGEEPFVLVLDSLEDPQNLGTLLRSAEACGVHGVVYPTRHAAPLTAAAIKASAGASEHLLLAPVDSLPGTLADLRSAGLRLVGADEGAALRYSEADLRGPLALVVGSEERGISGALRRRLDMSVRIPMRGRVASLNAAVAGSVLLFAAAEQRGTPEADEMTAGEQPLAEGKPQGEPEPDGKPEGEAEAPAKRAPRRRKPSSTSAADPGETGEADLLPGEPEGSQPA